MSIAEKLTTIAENEQRVFEAGKKSEYDAFWDNLQNYGNRTEYQTAFARWGNSIIEPKYPIKVSNAYELFRSCSNLTAIPDNLTFDTTASDCSIYTAFYYCPKLVRIDQELKGSGPVGVWNAFTGCRKLVSVKKLTIDATCTNDLNNTFAACESLTDIEFAGTIAANYLDMHWSTGLSKASIESLINILSTTTSGKKITLSQTSVNNAFTEEEWTTLVATKPNWTIALV